MDPMKPVCSEQNRIEMPSLKDVLLHSIDILDEHFSGEGIGRKVIDQAKVVLYNVEQITEMTAESELYSLDRVEGDTATVGHALGHRHADTQARVTARTLRDSHSIQGDSMTLSEAQSLLHKDTAFRGVVRALGISLLKDDMSIFCYSHGTHLCAGFNM